MPQFYSRLSFLLSNYRSCLAGSGRKTSEAGLYVSIPLDRKNSNPHGRGGVGVSTVCTADGHPALIPAPSQGGGVGAGL